MDQPAGQEGGNPGVGLPLAASVSLFGVDSNSHRLPVEVSWQKERGPGNVAGWQCSREKGAGVSSAGRGA